MIKVQGFCDLCVDANGISKNSLKDTCSKLVSLGYKSVAINQTIDDSCFESKKKKKKGEVREIADIVPLPMSLDFAEEFENKLQIFHRLTISYADQTNIHKLNQSQNLKKYNLLAILPTTPQAVQHACGGALDFDIFTFNPENRNAVKLNRKLYNMLTDRKIYFELMYSPAIRDNSARKNIIQMSHLYHAYGKSKNIILCSNASEPIHVRAPYDIINLLYIRGLIFGLSEEQSKTAILSNCRKVIIRAEGRRHGKAVMIVKQVSSILPVDSETENSDDDMEGYHLEPALKKTRM